MTANALTAISGGRAPGGWEELWASDRWALRELPHADLQSTDRDGAILFDRIAQPWLKEAAKRWARARLLAGGAPSTMAHNVLHVWAFSGWLAERVPEVSSPAEITRAALEDWLLAVRAGGLAAGTKTCRVSAVRVFLEERWEDGLGGLPRGATIHRADNSHARHKPRFYQVTPVVLGRRRATGPLPVSQTDDRAVESQPAASPRTYRSGRTSPPRQYKP